MTDIPDNFADHPESLNERRAQLKADAREWTPRDVLIHALRQLDSGEIKPEGLTVVYYEPDEHYGTRDRFITGGTNRLTMVGALMGAVTYMMQKHP